jgi:lysophospholipase L1-like esterase
VEQRIAIAKETEVALWDLFQAMGGRSSMKRMKRRGLAISDFTHFNAAGGAWVGDRLGHALMSALAAHAARNPRLGCDPK